MFKKLHFCFLLNLVVLASAMEPMIEPRSQEDVKDPGNASRDGSMYAYVSPDRHHLAYGACAKVTKLLDAPLQSIKLLLDAGADVNLCAPKSPLYYAIERGDTKIIDLLVEHGARL